MFFFLTRQAFHSLREIFFELNYLVTIRYMKEFSDSTTAREKLYGLLYKGVAPATGGETSLSTLRSIPSVFL